MYHWLNYLSSSSILVPLGFSLYRYKQLKDELKIVTVFFVIASLTEAILNITSLKMFNNLWLINIFSVIEAFTFCFVIGKWFNSKKMFRLAILLFILYFVYWLYSVLMNGDIFKFNGAEKSVKAFVLIFLSGCLLVRLSSHEETPILENYRFWIAAAIMIYFSITLVVYCTEAFLIDGKGASYYTWIIHSVTNIVSNFLIAFGFLWYYRKMNSFI
jgi:hypothetical protein